MGLVTAAHVAKKMLTNRVRGGTLLISKFIVQIMSANVNSQILLVITGLQLHPIPICKLNLPDWTAKQEG